MFTGPMVVTVVPLFVPFTTADIPPLKVTAWFAWMALKELNGTVVIIGVFVPPPPLPQAPRNIIALSASTFFTSISSSSQYLPGNSDSINRIPLFARRDITYLVPNSDAQQVVREVGLAEGLEVDLVGGLELALLEDRFLRQAREALAHLACELGVLQVRLVERRFDQREAHERVVVVARHRVQDTRGRRLRGVAGELEHRLVGVAIGRAAETGVDLLGNRLALAEHLARPLGERDVLAVADERKARFAAPMRHAL